MSQPTISVSTQPENGILDEDLSAYDLAARRAANTQLYQNSALAGSSIEDDYDSNPDQFYNSKDPNLAIKHENARHRLVVFLKAQGKTNRKIAELTKFTEQWVSQILRQPWARQLLIRELREAGQDVIQGILAGACEDSIFKLIELRDQAKEPAVQRGCANDLLDRFLGKPTQHIEQETKHTIRAEDIEEVNAELAELEAEEKRLIGTN